MTRLLRKAESSTPSQEIPLMLTLDHWHADPVAALYLSSQPTERATLRHKTFSDALLYRGLDGGAIILQTPDKRVLAMDYCDDDDLRSHWRETLRHYAGVL